MWRIRDVPLTTLAILLVWALAGLGTRATAMESATVALLEQRLAFWRGEVFRCAARSSGFTFPSGTAPAGEPGREDGDMTLVAGLLCIVGEEEGCETVRRSQQTAAGNDHGRWYRSPRQLESGNDADEDGRLNEREAEGEDKDGDGRTEENERNTSSFDMALGTILYLAAKPDRKADAQARWDWLAVDRVCLKELAGTCLLRVPGFCAEPACLIRPDPIFGGDYAMLAEIESLLDLKAPSGSFFRGRIGDGVGEVRGQILAGARLSDQGFSEHIEAVKILALRRMGRDHPDLAAAARRCPRTPSSSTFAMVRPRRSPRACWKPARRRGGHPRPTCAGTGSGSATTPT